MLALMEECAGNAHISFEGDLSRIALVSFADASPGESSALKRNTIWPKQNFIILPLEKGAGSSIMRALGGTIPRTVIHIQIEKSGELVAGMYDNFSPDAIYFSSVLSEDFLKGLIKQGLLQPLN